jgi:hypothetical protein
VLSSDLGLELVLDHSPRAAARLVATEAYDVVVAGYPLDRGDLGLLVAGMRGRGSATATSGLLLLTQPEHLRAASSLIGRGVNKVLSIAEDPAVVRIVVSRLMDTDHPSAERFPLHLTLEIVAGERKLRAATENVSATGMLVAVDEPLAAGHRVRFRMELPDGSEVLGEAKVVRPATVEREGVIGVGIRFASFDGDGRTRLLKTLRQLRAAPGA